MRRLAATAAALWLIASLIVPLPATARTVAPELEPAVTPSVTESCQTGSILLPPDMSKGNPHSQQTNGSPNGRSGVAATIDIDAGFNICYPHPGDWDDNGPAAYVSLEPRAHYTPSQPDGCEFDLSCILQVGIQECASAGFSGCAGEGNPHFFWALGGCDGAHPLPIDLGPANYSPHSYAIYYTGSPTNTFRGTIDGREVFEIDIEHWKIRCWSFELLTAVWAGERWDYGDSLGNSGSPTRFTTARYGLAYQGWFSPNWSLAQCNFEEPDDQCVIGAGGYGDRMNMWTDD